MKLSSQYVCGESHNDSMVIGISLKIGLCITILMTLVACGSDIDTTFPVDENTKKPIGNRLVDIDADEYGNQPVTSFDCVFAEGGEFPPDSAEFQGKTEYTNACGTCHGSSGLNGSVAVIDGSDGYLGTDPQNVEYTELYDINLYTMPENSPEDCDEDCARKVTRYIRTWDRCTP